MSMVNISQRAYQESNLGAFVLPKSVEDALHGVLFRFAIGLNAWIRLRT